MSKVKLIYDISAVPDNIGMSMNDVYNAYMEHDVVFYDSSKNEGGLQPNKPEIVVIEGESEVKVIDTSTEEGKAVIDNLAKL